MQNLDPLACVTHSLVDYVNAGDGGAVQTGVRSNNPDLSV
jgi:hypothetical protein